MVQAEKALSVGEVPVGAVLVQEGKILAKAHNMRETLHDATAHAEMLVIRKAGELQESWRLPGTILYVTLEPCAMCAAAIVQARIQTVVYAADDWQVGAAGSFLNLVREPRFHHQVNVYAGYGAEEAQDLLQKFFSQKRHGGVSEPG